MNREMMRALEADAEKLRAMTGDDSHQIAFLDEDCDVCGCWPCAHTDPDSWEFRQGIPSLKGDTP